MSIFKVGDRVYDHLYGWGKVDEFSDKSPFFPITVRFGKYPVNYTEKGFRHATGTYPSLSFTEYDFVNGGFSQERPEHIIEPGTPCFVRDHKGSRWLVAEYVKYERHQLYPHLVKLKESFLESFKYVRLDHPFKKEQ